MATITRDYYVRFMSIFIADHESGHVFELYHNLANDSAIAGNQSDRDAHDIMFNKDVGRDQDAQYNYTVSDRALILQWLNQLPTSVQP